jgi:hypothetical protein
VFADNPGAGYGGVNCEQIPAAIRTRFSKGTDSLDRARVAPAVEVRLLYGWFCGCQRLSRRAEAFAGFLGDVTFALGTITSGGCCNARIVGAGLNRVRQEQFGLQILNCRMEESMIGPPQAPWKRRMWNPGVHPKSGPSRSFPETEICHAGVSMRDPEIIEAELMEISAIADDTLKFERIVAWCASHPDEVSFALHQLMSRSNKHAPQTS